MCCEVGVCWVGLGGGGWEGTGGGDLGGWRMGGSMIDRTRAHDTHHALEQVEPPVEERGGREHRGLELGLFRFVVFWVVLGCFVGVAVG